MTNRDKGTRYALTPKGEEATVTRQIKVYLAAPFAMHESMEKIAQAWVPRGVSVCSTWHIGVTGPERLPEHTNPDVRFAIGANDRDLAAADALVAFPVPGEGGEMFCEITRALIDRKPVIWAGERRILSTFRPGVLLCGRENVFELLRQICIDRGFRVPT